jgi:hypothetical protein
MKTTTMILAALVFGIFYTTSGNAKSGTENQATEKQLTQTIKSLFRNAPLEDLMEGNEKCSLEVQFSIDKDNKITDVQVNGKNHELANYVTRHLTKARIQLSSPLIHRTYQTTLYFALRS